MMEDNGDLEKLKRRLYKEGEGFDVRTKREKLKEIKGDTRTFWEGSSLPRNNLRETIKRMVRKKSRHVYWLVPLIFFVSAVGGVLFYIFFGSGNIISAKNISLSVEGSSTVNSGEANKWYISVQNNNQVKLEMADLIIEHPDGFLSASGDPLSKERRQLGEIAPGAVKQEEINAFVLAESEKALDIIISLEYRTEGSNAIFAKSIKYTVQVSRSPVGVSLALPNEAESGQPFTLAVDCVSNSDVVVKNMYLKMEFPPGFQLLTASFEPAAGGTTWLVGDLAPQEKRHLEIKGLLEGQDSTELGFNALAGLLDDKGEFYSFSSAADSLLLKKSFANLSFLVNGKNIDVVSGKKTLTVSVSWQNNLSTEIREASISVKLTSRVIDSRTISVLNGSYRSYDNTVVWNASSLSELASVAPGQSGSAQFSFSLLDVFPVQTLNDKNFSFVMDGQMLGTRTEEGQNVGLKSATSKEIKVATDIQLSSSLLYSSGSFPNSGPMPPKVGKETTYTVVWSVRNFYNDVSDLVVRASLPPYVSWPNVFEPAGENLQYNPATGEVIWRADKVEAATGILRPARQVSFKISFLPGPDQVGDSPILVSQAFFEARDIFTGFLFSDFKNALTAGAVNEAQISADFGKVIE